MGEESLVRNDARQMPDPAAALANAAQQAKDAVTGAAAQGAKAAAAGARMAAAQGAKAAAAGAKAASEGARIAAEGAKVAAEQGAKAAVAGAAAAAAGAKQVHQAFGGEYGDTFEGNVRDEAGNVIVPEPLVDEYELKKQDEITERYQKLVDESKIQKLGKKVVEAAPKQLKDAAKNIGGAVGETLNGLTKQQLIADALKTAAEGFSTFEEQAAKATLGREYVLQRVNAGKQEEKVSDLDEICLLRAYDISKVVGNEKFFHVGLAAIEGGGTGAAGFAGLPANLVLSMLVYFRAVQSVAMFYGYDVKNDPDELVIAGDVFSKAMAPAGTDVNADVSYVGKVLLFAEAAGVQQAAKKGWQAMAEAGGAALLLAQMRETANAAAKKALAKAGQKSLEEGIFTNVFKQVGRELTLKSIGKMVPVIGAGFGALIDSAQMRRVIEFADLFYCKRFIMEKPERVKKLCGGTTEVAVDVAEEAGEE